MTGTDWKSLQHFAYDCCIQNANLEGRREGGREGGEGGREGGREGGKINKIERWLSATCKYDLKFLS